MSLDIPFFYAIVLYVNKIGLELDHDHWRNIMIGKRFAWDSNFTIESLEKEGLTQEHNPLFRFPFLSLKGLRMEDVDVLICPSCNSPRGYRDIFVGKQEPLSSSLLEGWWVHSWLIPLLNGIYFDRRHTVKTILELNRLNLINAKYIPVADYQRVYVDHEPLISSFSDDSIMQMAGMIANVVKGDDDAKGDHFVNTCQEIIKREYKISENPELKTKEFIGTLLKYMGAGIRFSDKTGYVSTGLPNRVWNNINHNPTPGIGQKTFGVEDENRNKFINNSDDWKDGCWNNNEQDDKYVYRVYALNNIEDHHRTVYQKITQWVYQLENEARKQPTVTGELLEPKILKVLLWCRQAHKFEAAHAPNIISARSKFKKHFTKYFYDTKDSVTSKFQEAFPKHYDEYCKNPNDYKLEIHFMPQIEGEDENETIQWEDMNRPGKFDNLNEEFGT